MGVQLPLYLHYLLSVEISLRWLIGFVCKGSTR
jgi:hypothetical protein